MKLNSFPVTSVTSIAYLAAVVFGCARVEAQGLPEGVFQPLGSHPINLREGGVEPGRKTPVPHSQTHTWIGD